MAYREVTRVEIQEIIRRWRAGEGYRQISSGTGVSRNGAPEWRTQQVREFVASLTI